MASTIPVATQAAGVGAVSADGVPDPRQAQLGANLQLVHHEAETRKAIAEAERGELLAPLRPATSRALPGAADTRQFGAAGLVRAFDVAQQLAGQVCAALPPDRQTAIYETAAAQGILAARVVPDGIVRLGNDLSNRTGSYSALSTPTRRPDRKFNRFPSRRWRWCRQP